MKITSDSFGRTGGGQEVTRFVLTEGELSVSVLTLGGIIQSIRVPDRQGKVTDVVLGFDSVQEYESQSCYIGALLGRCANRIAGSEVKLGQTSFQVVCNDNGVCHLHGGIAGFDKKIWTPEVTERGLKLLCTSPDGEEGYPGTLTVSVEYCLEHGGLSLTYCAVSDRDTLCNLSNHAYFNLAGHASGSVGAQEVQVLADRYTPIGINCAPDGSILPVEHTPMDLRSAAPLGAHWDDAFPQITLAGGYDHNYLVGGEGMRVFARAYSRQSGIRLTVRSDLPGMQLYSGNYLNIKSGKGGAAYERRCGFCIETQYPPNAVNCPGFPVPLLRAGEQYRSKTCYQFDIL